jgi:hypothetical protein
MSQQIFVSDLISHIKMSCPVSKVLDYSFIHTHIHDFTDRFMNLGIVLLQWWKYMIDWGKKKEKRKEEEEGALASKISRYRMHQKEEEKKQAP